MTDLLWDIHYIMNDLKPVLFYAAAVVGLIALKMVME